MDIEKAKNVDDAIKVEEEKKLEELWNGIQRLKSWTSHSSNTLTSIIIKPVCKCSVWIKTYIYIEDSCGKKMLDKACVRILG